MVWLGIAALLASLVTAGAGIYNTYQTNQQNIELNRENREWNREQVIDERNYNTPVNQMQRLADAGLNSNLAYGSVTPTSPGAATSVAPEVQPFDISSLQDVSNSLLQNRQLDIEHQRVDQEGKQVDSVVKYNDAAVIDLGTHSKVNEAQRAVLQQKVTNLGKEVEVMNSTIEVNRARIASLDASAREKSLQADLLEFEKEHQFEKFQAELNQLDATTKKLLSEADISAQQLYEYKKTFWLRYKGYELDNIYSSAKISNLNADTNNKLASLTGINLENERLSVAIETDKVEQIGKRLNLATEMSVRGVAGYDPESGLFETSALTSAYVAFKLANFLLRGK